MYDLNKYLKKQKVTEKQCGLCSIRLTWAPLFRLSISKFVLFEIEGCLATILPDLKRRYHRWYAFCLKMPCLVLISPKLYFYST